MGESNLDIKRVPFSKHYKTWNDYLKDRDIVSDIAYAEKEIPDELFQKLLETRKEVEARGEDIV